MTILIDTPDRPEDILVERHVQGDCLHTVERKRLLVHTIASAVDEALRNPAADSAGIFVTVHEAHPSKDNSDLVVTVTAPSRARIHSPV